MKMIQTIWEFLKTNWAPIIATLAFLVSFATLYYTYWQPFKPQIYSSGRYEVLRSGQTYDEEWNYTFSKAIPLLTQTQSAVWFYIKDDKIIAIDVW